MTAIISVHGPYGFVVGADGRQTDGASHAVISDSTQKVFLADLSHLPVVYAWSGMTEAFNLSNKRTLDLKQFTSDALNDAADHDKSFLPFLERFKNELMSSLPSEMTGAPSREIARLFLAGYFQEKPFRAVLKIKSVQGTVDEVMDVQFPLSYHKCVLSGAKSVYRRYEGLDLTTEEQGISFVKNYIEECAASSDLDCESIGGHVHIARLNLDGGERVIPPLCP
jgi:hypothetical protein